MVAPRRFALLGHTHNLDDLVGDSDDIDEGSTNLFFTDERARDAVGAILTDTASVDLVYTDAGAAAGTITATVLPAGVDHNSLANLATGDPHTQYELEANLTEDVQDIVGAFLQDSTSIDFTYSDAGNTITVAVKDEYVQDTVGVMFTDSASIDFTYDDTAGTETAIVIDDAITNAKLANMIQATIKGRAAAAGTGDPTDLTAAQVATIVNSSLDHGTLTGLSDDDHPQYPLAASAETISGAWDFTDTVDILADNKELTLGAGNDLRFYHDGTNSIIRNDTGILKTMLGATTRAQLRFASASTFCEIFANDANTQTAQFSATGRNGSAADVNLLFSAQGDAGGYGVLGMFTNHPLIMYANSIEHMRLTQGVSVDFSFPILTRGYTVATLPAGTIGMLAHVTDALTPTFGAAAVGGGAVKLPVFYNGTNWVTI